MPQLKPGVVTGEDYITLINACKKGKYALPAVNVTGTNTVNAVLEAAAANKSDVIIQCSNSGAAFYAGKGFPDSFEAKVMGAVAMAQHVHLLAGKYGVCVILHTDHADKKLIPWVEALMDYNEKHYKTYGKSLFTSHMLDLSAEDIDYNLAECKKMLTRMAKIDMSIEIELGVTGGEEDGVGSDDVENDKLYTQPEDVMKAYEILKDIGHFSVAASFGNVHGVYKPGNVQLRPEILKNSQSLVQKTYGLSENPLDLVFHGGSGSEKAKIDESLNYGIFKMNIDTDTQFAFAEGIGKYVFDHPNAFKYQIDPDTDEPTKKKYDPRVWLRKGEESVIERLNEAFTDLRSKGKSLALTENERVAA